MLLHVPHVQGFSAAEPQLPCACSSAAGTKCCPARSHLPATWCSVLAARLQDEIFGELISSGALRGEVESEPVFCKLRGKGSKEKAPNGTSSQDEHLPRVPGATVGWHCVCCVSREHPRAASPFPSAHLSPEKPRVMTITIWAGGPCKPAALFFFPVLPREGKG